MDHHRRAELHAALGQHHRLAIVDHLLVSDATVSELQSLTDLESNALAHHLTVLEDVGLIERLQSEGDRRLRYVRLRPEPLGGLVSSMPLRLGSVVFVCTHNSARSQFAAAQWQSVTGIPAMSAGSDPAASVNPMAVEIAGEFGLDLSDQVTRGYDAIPEQPDLVVSVCDRAREHGVPDAGMSLHWSTPDPVAVGSRSAFRTAFTDLANRIDRIETRSINEEGPS
jgi:protein-tyrosine-phosphatase